MSAEDSKKVIFSKEIVNADYLCTAGLTEEETAERDKLRRIYIDSPGFAWYIGLIKKRRAQLCTDLDSLRIS